MIMKPIYKFFVAIVLVLSVRGYSYSQELPSLPQDPAVSSGVLPNGVSYYIVANRTMKGVADFALVQKTAFGKADSMYAGYPLRIARESLDSLPKFGTRKPECFLADYGMDERRGRLVSADGNSTVYRFEGFSLSRGDVALDSTFLMMFDIVGGTRFSGDSTFAGMYPTAASAIVVSGDVDANAILSKLKLLSLMVPERKGDPVTVPYEWKPSDSADFSVVADTSLRYARADISYSSPRTPANYMGTVLPTVSERLGDMFGIILRKRLAAEFKSAGVPVGNMYFRYVRSSDTPGNERYVISFTTSPDMLGAAVGTAASVLSYLDSKGIGEEEYSVVRDEYLIDIYDESRRPAVPNRKYVDRCISSFLYGADMATPSEKFNFFMSSSLQDSTLTRLFNNFVSKLLDRDRNLSVRCATPSAGLSSGDISGIYRSAWDREAASSAVRLYPVRSADELPDNLQDNRIRLVSDRREHLTGGRLWTFSNGMKVIYKRQDTQGIIYYTLALKGGYSMMDGLRKGEGAFLSDVLETYDIAGMRSEDFHYLMSAEGITMSSRVGISDIRISGKAPRDAVPVMVKALKAVANNRSVNRDAYNYLKSSIEVELKAMSDRRRDRIAAIDSLMCPSYIYSSARTLADLGDDLPERANAFFESQFSHANEGVLVIVGDMEETAMRKLLQPLLSGFRTSRTPSSGIRLPYQPISGWSTYTRDGKRTSTDVVMSVPLTFTAENYMAARVAAAAVGETVARELCGTSCRAAVSYDIIMYPQERFNLMITVEEADPDGFPAGARKLGFLEMLYSVREVLDSLSSSPVPESDLEAYRSEVCDDLYSRQTDPEFIAGRMVMRYIYGKDLMTKYEEKVKAVSAERVRELISALDGGSKIEYVIMGK